MKVLDLRCRHGHAFEGWFASEDDFREQQERGLMACPLCDDREVSRLPSAPRLNLSGAKDAPPAAPRAAEPAPAPQPAVSAQLHASFQSAMQAVWLKAARQVIANTEDVGTKFAEEARRIHYGDAQARGIRGHATVDEAQALAEEGIEFGVMPLPDALKEPLQ
jgi:hypothetical protein